MGDGAELCLEGVDMLIDKKFDATYDKAAAYRKRRKEKKAAAKAAKAAVAGVEAGAATAAAAGPKDAGSGSSGRRRQRSSHRRHASHSHGNRAKASESPHAGCIKCSSYKGWPAREGKEAGSVRVRHRDEREEKYGDYWGRGAESRDSGYESAPRRTVGFLDADDSRLPPPDRRSSNYWSFWRYPFVSPKRYREAEAVPRTLPRAVSSPGRPGPGDAAGRDRPVGRNDDDDRRYPPSSGRAAAAAHTRRDMDREWQPDAAAAAAAKPERRFSFFGGSSKDKNKEGERSSFEDRGGFSPRVERPRSANYDRSRDSPRSRARRGPPDGWFDGDSEIERDLAQLRLGRDRDRDRSYGRQRRSNYY